MKLNEIQKSKKVARYALDRAYQANRLQKNPLPIDALKKKIADHIMGRQEWAEFKGYLQEGFASVELANK